jgi:hypothetical protein
MHDRRCGAGTRSNDERLAAEAADEVTDSFPLALLSMSPWYHDMPNGALGCWMTNRSNS